MKKNRETKLQQSIIDKRNAETRLITARAVKIEMDCDAKEQEIVDLYNDHSRLLTFYREHSQPKKSVVPELEAEILSLKDRLEYASKEWQKTIDNNQRLLNQLDNLNIKSSFCKDLTSDYTKSKRKLKIYGTAIIIMSSLALIQLSYAIYRLFPWKF